MMTKGLVLREVPLLFPCCAGTRRGQAPWWSDEKKGVRVCDSDPVFLLSEAQGQAFETKPAPG
jgi:hypothetical protein